MTKIIRTDSANSDFKRLVSYLDAELKERDGDDHAFYNQYNSIENLNHCVVLFADKQAVACGAMKLFDDNSMEIKRMYTLPGFRGKGHASLVLQELEQWADEMKISRTILETGKRQPEAIELYERRGYSRIENYGQYIGIDNSVCFEKNLNKRN